LTPRSRFIADMVMSPQINNGYAFDGLIKKLKAIEPEFTKAANLKKR